MGGFETRPYVPGTMAMRALKRWETGFKTRPYPGLAHLQVGNKTAYLWH